MILLTNLNSVAKNEEWHPSSNLLSQILALNDEQLTNWVHFVDQKLILLIFVINCNNSNSLIGRLVFHFDFKQTRVTNSKTKE